jgi:hypothetical protein
MPKQVKQKRDAYGKALIALGENFNSEQPPQWYLDQQTAYKDSAMSLDCERFGHEAECPVVNAPPVIGARHGHLFRLHTKRRLRRIVAEDDSMPQLREEI